jgi:hypothetical protein
MSERIQRDVRDGGIVLMHSGMKNTTQMLPEVIARLRERGYHFVTVSTLLGLTPVRTPFPADIPLMQTATTKTF